MRHLALLCLLMSCAAMAQTQYGSTAKPDSMPHASTGCPWLTQGSAAHTLGGEVSVTVKVSEGEGTCSFTRQQPPADSLEVIVSKAALAACPPGSMALRGIGNEALTCRRGGPHDELIEMISSRVRDSHFTVTMTSRARSTAKSDDPQNDALEQIAEQVAGNLY
jgi:hypothetical protein